MNKIQVQSVYKLNKSGAIFYVKYDSFTKFSVIEAPYLNIVTLKTVLNEEQDKIDLT